MQIKDLPILRFLAHPFKKNESNEKFQGKRVVSRESTNSAIAQLSENIASILKFLDVPTSETSGCIVRVRSIRSIRSSLSLQASRMSPTIRVPRKAEKGVSLGQLFVPCLTSRQYQFSTTQKCSEGNFDASICSPAVRSFIRMVPRLRLSSNFESTRLSKENKFFDGDGR